MELQITTLMADGDHRGALKLMAEAYGGAIGRFCAALTGSRADADDLLQETFVDAWQAMERFRAESNVRAWLFGIARRVCIRHLRKRDRRANLLKRWFGSGSESELPGDPAERSEQEEMLRKALWALRPELREAVLLRYQASMDHAEIALALGVSPAAARKRVSLGVSALRDSLRSFLMEPPKSETGQEGEHEGQGEESVSARPGPRIVRP